jgi:hypothetical protein
MALIAENKQLLFQQSSGTYASRGIDASTFADK